MATSRGIRGRTAGTAALVVVLLLFPLQRAISRNLGAMEADEPQLIVSSGPLLQKLSMGYAPLMADIYWTRAIQNFGTHLANQDTNVSLLAPLLNITVSLDPQLKVAYQFGAIFLAEAQPLGAGRPDQAIALVERGIAANPSDWQLEYQLGCIYYWNARDYKAAADAFWKTSSMPGAPEWMKAFAAAVEQKGNSPEASRVMWQEAFRESKDPRLKENAQYQLGRLQLEQDLKNLDLAMGEFEKRTRHAAGSVQELVSAGILRGVPVDPSGYVYRICARSLGAAGGAACVDPASPWSRVPVDAK
jgi:tetratricopeptide (TPR) repeat protein